MMILNSMDTFRGYRHDVPSGVLQVLTCDGNAIMVPGAIHGALMSQLHRHDAVYSFGLLNPLVTFCRS